MRTRLVRVLSLSLLFPLNALATPHLLEPDSLDGQFLADYHGATPTTPPAPVRHSTPARVGGGRADFFLIGLGLAAGGLVLGGAGFGVLYACRTGTSCHNDTTTTVGWVLAAPGVIPLTIGLIMMYASSGSSVRVLAPAASPSSGWAFGVSPLAGGALISAATLF